jgi:hypothetical protein
MATSKNILCIGCKYFIFDIKLLLGNAGNNEENNCKPDHIRLALLCHWLVKDK